MRALEDALENFAGTVLVISHDRWFLDRIATHILAFENDSQIDFFDGNYNEYEADRVVAETNQGGDMVEQTIRNIDRRIAYRGVRATRGKIVRAEPIAELYERGLVHHVGEFQLLEDEMCSYCGFDNEKSPDRMDALVWALTELSQRGVGSRAILA